MIFKPNPCPFCGSDYIETYMTMWDLFGIKCLNCGLYYEATTINEVEKRWNWKINDIIYPVSELKKSISIKYYLIFWKRKYYMQKEKERMLAGFCIRRSGKV